jgi:hypothetical protein
VCAAIAMDSKSVASSSRAGSNVRFDYRVLCGILTEKAVLVGNHMELKIVESDMKRVAAIVKELCDNTDRIKSVEVLLQHGDTVVQAAKIKRGGDDGSEGGTHFDGLKVR